MTGDKLESSDIEHDRVWYSEGGSSTRSVCSALNDLENELTALRERVTYLERLNEVEP